MANQPKVKVCTKSRSVSVSKQSESKCGERARAEGCEGGEEDGGKKDTRRYFGS